MKTIIELEKENKYWEEQIKKRKGKWKYSLETEALKITASKLQTLREVLEMIEEWEQTNFGNDENRFEAMQKLKSAIKGSIANNDK